MRPKPATAGAWAGWAGWDTEQCLDHSAGQLDTDENDLTERDEHMTAQTNTKRSLAQRWANYQPTKSTLGWACVGAAGATMIIGFTWGGWVTGGTSRGVAANAEIAARGELASARSASSASTPSRALPNGSSN